MVEQSEHPGRNVDERVQVARAGLEQQDACPRLAQPVRQHAAGGTGADDDVVGGRRLHRSDP